MTLPSGEDLLLLHNPDCSKSRAALEWLGESGRVFAAREYLKDPLDAGEIEEVGRRLGLPLRAWVRLTGEDLEVAVASDGGLLAHLVRHPKCMQRPILLSGNSGVVGRPLEALADWCCLRTELN